MAPTSSLACGAATAFEESAPPLRRASIFLAKIGSQPLGQIVDDAGAAELGERPRSA